MDVTENHTIHIVFKSDIHTITASATAGGYISPLGVINVPTGETKTFTFAAVGDYELARVLVDGINNSDAVQNGYYSFFNVTDNHTIAAQFEKKQYTVSLPEVAGVLFTPTDGSTSPVEHGGKFTFTVELQAGYTQSNIAVFANNVQLFPFSGVYIINNIIANQVVTITGVELNKYKVVAKANVGGTISPSGTFMVTHGDDKTFEITPDASYIIKEVLVNGVSQGALETYTFLNVIADATIDAYFLYDVGIDENETNNIQVFSHYKTVTIVNETLIPIQQVEIMDMFGRIVWACQAPNKKNDITLNIATGIYAVRIITSNDQSLTTKIVIDSK